ncbi:MAG: glycosyltransferase family 4 protein, partial [Anaerolineaceae bacterium]|nr:glycosyltransferase family 4 protein [Anaerolineaceae bacterium]
MRILTLTDLYPPHYVGGYELRCKETADEIASRGHELIVLTSWWGLEKPMVEKNVYRILNIDPTRNLKSQNGLGNESRYMKRVNQLRWAFLCRKNYTTTRDILTAFKPDVVYIWNLCHLGINPVLAAQDLGIPTVFTLGIDWLYVLKNELFHDPSLVKKKFRQIMNNFYDFKTLETRHLITISHALKQSYIENGFPEKNITVIPRGIPSKVILDQNQNGKLN